MSSSFTKKRNDIAFIVDPSNNIQAVFLYPYRGWYKNNFKAAMKSFWSGTFPKDELSQMPIWYGKGGATVTGMEIYAVTGFRIPDDPTAAFGAAFAAGLWDTQAEVISQGDYPLRGNTAGTYVLRVDFDATTIDVDVTTAITGGGDVNDIVQLMNAIGGFAAIGEAFVAGAGDAAQLGLRSKGVGISSAVTILTTVTNDCSALLGFTAEKKNMYDKGDSATLIGTFDQYSHVKTG